MKSCKGIYILILIIIGLIILPSAYAGTWSSYMKVTHVSSGEAGTYIYSNVTFPSGSTSGRILPTTTGHNKMMAEVMMAISLDLYMRFYLDDNGFIVQALIYNP